jgi:hypothetical protein
MYHHVWPEEGSFLIYATYLYLSFLFSLKNIQCFSLVPEVDAYNHCCSGDGNWEDHGSRPALTKKLARLHLNQ